MLDVKLTCRCALSLGLRRLHVSSAELVNHAIVIRLSDEPVFVPAYLASGAIDVLCHCSNCPPGSSASVYLENGYLLSWRSLPDQGVSGNE